ncbi:MULTISPECIES: hypothetical protein [unclassified Nocardia]|uniref:hypothetical protein n=1 Tax=unclassified Nocardia TaxID=2637762 RepID=UPI0034185853
MPIKHDLPRWLPVGPVTRVLLSVEGRPVLRGGREGVLDGGVQLVCSRVWVFG